jgi:glyoxylase-like metal-dependent hydrolase (beta-lactamase superfamily II)
VHRVVTIDRVILERSMNDDFLSNTYLVASDEHRAGFFVDAGGPVAPLLAAARERDIDVTHVLLTHHHWDHVSQLPEILEAYPDAEVLVHPLERPLVADEFAGHITGTMDADEELVIGGLTVRTLHTPGHTRGMLSLLVDGNVFTGDTLFKNSVGGVRAPGHTTFADIKHAIMDVLLALPGDTVLRPGHTDPSTVAEELETNTFVRIWRGLDPEGAEPCTALGEPATLVHLGDDYDGGHKAWVRWPDGSDDIVPGSRIVRG